MPTLSIRTIVVVTLALSVVCVPAVADSREKCSCEHFDKIKAARKSAKEMFDFYSKLVGEYERQELPIAMGPGTYDQKKVKLDAIRQKGEAGVGGATDTLIRFNNEKCEPEPADLKKEMERQPCREAAEITSHHEDYHHDVCAIRRKWGQARRTAAPIPDRMIGGMSIGMPSADAQEEVNAYQLQLSEYDALIKKVEALTSFALTYDSKSVADVMGGATKVHTYARFVLAIDEGPEPRKFSSQAMHKIDATFEGSCEMVAQPVAVKATVEGTLSDGRLRAKYSTDVNTSWRVTCPPNLKFDTPFAFVPRKYTANVEAKDGAEQPVKINRGPVSQSVVWRVEDLCRKPR